MRGVLRALPWLMVLASASFAAITWRAAPDFVPMRLDLAGNAAGATEKTVLSWFGLSLVALVTVALLSVLRTLVSRRPEYFNHPDKARLLALPAAYRDSAVTELRTVLDVAAAQVMATILLVQWFLYRSALGHPSPAATPVIMISAVISGPMLLVLLSRVSTAVDEGERRWRADGRPSATRT